MEIKGTISDENAQPHEEIKEAIKQIEVQKAPQPILLDDKGRMLAKNNSELLRYCGALITSEMVPKQFNKPEKLFGALMFARSLNLPDTAIRQIAVIHGTPSLFGDLPLAMVQQTGKMTYFKEQWFDEEYKIICFENKNLHIPAHGAVCFAAREGQDVQSFSFTMDDAIKAGVYPPSSNAMPWAKYTRIMLRYKARSIALKSLFADKISGVAIAEYDFDENDTQNIKDVSPQAELADELNKGT